MIYSRSEVFNATSIILSPHLGENIYNRVDLLILVWYVLDAVHSLFEFVLAHTSSKLLLTLRVLTVVFRAHRKSLLGCVLPGVFHLGVSAPQVSILAFVLSVTIHCVAVARHQFYLVGIAFAQIRLLTLPLLCWQSVHNRDRGHLITALLVELLLVVLFSVPIQPMINRSFGILACLLLTAIAAIIALIIFKIDQFVYVSIDRTIVRTVHQSSPRVFGNVRRRCLPKLV